MKKYLSAAMSVALAIIAVLSLLVEPAHADLVKNTRLKVVPYSELREEHYHVYYGPQYLFDSHGIMDSTEAAAKDGLVYDTDHHGEDALNLYIVPDDNYAITAVQIISGSVEYYSRGNLVEETHTIDITDPKLLKISAEELGYTDGEGATHIEEGGSSVRNIPNNYTGVAYYSEPDATGQHYFTIAITTELENSGAVVLEESSAGARLQSQYTIKVAGLTMTGTAQSVMNQFATAHAQGHIKPDDRVEVIFDPNYVGYILVRKGSGGFDDPKAPDWILTRNSLSFTLGTENRVMRIMFNNPPGSTRLVQGTNPLKLSTEIEISHYTNLITKELEYFQGDINQVNAKLAEWQNTFKLWNDDEVFFRLINPENVDSVKIATKRIRFGREEALTPYGENVLKGAGWSISLTNTQAVEFQINYRRTPGKLFIQETAPNQGIYTVSVFYGTTRIYYHEDTAAISSSYVNAALERGEFTLGATVNIKFPDSAVGIRVATGSKPSEDITEIVRLEGMTYSYQVTAEDKTFYVVYKDAGKEIIINPTVPVDPDVPPFDPSIFGGGSTGTPWTDPGSGAIPGTGWMPPVTGGTGTGCSCPFCTWMASMQQGYASTMMAKPQWSVQLDVAPADDSSTSSNLVQADSTVLWRDETYTFCADTDVLVTIRPVTSYPVDVTLSYTVDGATHSFTVSGMVGGPITATVKGKVSIDVEMGETGFSAQMPTYHAVHCPKPAEGTVYRDMNTAVAGDTVTVAVMPNSGRTVKDVQVLTIGGERITAKYLGKSAKGYAIYTFEMPEDDVTVTVSFQ